MVHRGLRDKEPSGCTATGKEPSLKSVGDSSSPEPERETSSSRDDIERLERVECGFKRQAVNTPTTTRRSGGRRSRRSIAALKRCVPEEDAGVLVGSSVMLNQIPSEVLETVLSCKFVLVIQLNIIVYYGQCAQSLNSVRNIFSRSSPWFAGDQHEQLWGGCELR